MAVEHPDDVSSPAKGTRARGAVGADDDPERTGSWRDVFADLMAVDRAVVEEVVGDTGLLGVQADLVIRLGSAPGNRSPMNALAAAMRVSGSSLTKLVDRLSDLGVARRDASSQDRRVVFVVLTDHGVQVAARLRERYVAVLRARVLAVVGDDLVGLAGVARRLAGPAPTPTEEPAAEPTRGPTGEPAAGPAADESSRPV